MTLNIPLSKHKTRPQRTKKIKEVQAERQLVMSKQWLQATWRCNIMVRKWSTAYGLQLVDRLVPAHVLHVLPCHPIKRQNNVHIHHCCAARSFKLLPCHDQSVHTLLLVASCLHSLLACTLLPLLLLPSWSFHRENCLAFPP